MRIFLCPSCSQVVYFESVLCTGCSARLGFVPARRTMAALKRAEGNADAPLYPFALSAPAVGKIAFVHRVIHDREAVSETASGPAAAISA